MVIAAADAACRVDLVAADAEVRRVLALIEARPEVLRLPNATPRMAKLPYVVCDGARSELIKLGYRVSRTDGETELRW